MTKNCTISVEHKTTAGGKPFDEVSVCVNGISIPLQLDFNVKKILLQIIGK